MIEGLSKKRGKQPYDASENKIQMAIIDYMRSSNGHKRGWTFFHVPNDGRQGKAQKIHNWRMGVLSGVPDIAIIAPSGEAMFIEVKTPSGPHSAYQKEFSAHCEHIGIKCEVARSLDDAILILDVWGFGKRLNHRIGEAA